MNVTAIIVVKNKPPHLLETLQSIEDFATEIIIGDLMMDAKIKEKLEHNSRFKIIPISKDIPYADLVKEDLKKEATGDYILYLDPDEIFPSTIKTLLIEKVDHFDYFFFPRKNFIFGKWISHSRWWPDYQLRFFKKDSVIWPKNIHPVPQTKGKEYKIEPKEENAILHYNYQDLDEYMEKMPRYAKGDAAERIARNEHLSLSQTVEKGISEFISRYFAYEGYKDGAHGFVLAFLQMFYYFLVYFYYWEHKKHPEIPLPEIISSTDHYFKQGLYETKFWKEKSGMEKKVLEKIKMKIVKRM